MTELRLDAPQLEAAESPTMTRCGHTSSETLRNVHRSLRESEELLLRLSREKQWNEEIVRKPVDTLKTLRLVMK
jgi:hypothetical protein